MCWIAKDVACIIYIPFFGDLNSFLYWHVIIVIDVTYNQLPYTNIGPPIVAPVRYIARGNQLPPSFSNCIKSIY